MKPGDRVTVIESHDEYSGLSGELVDLTKEGDVVVLVEVRTVTTWRVTFKPHDVELEELA